ncbi:MAG: WD40 repeat domain-containing protein [Planctomycetes bacterium]|nr:WD40 repeat domain-containing protein [Planctomycetota bacterium]
MRSSLFLGLLFVATACSNKEGDREGGAKAQAQKEGAHFAQANEKQDRSGGRPQAIKAFPMCAEFSPDGKRLAIAFTASGPYKGPLLKIWDVETRKQSDYWPIPPLLPGKKERSALEIYHGVHLVAWLPGGREILTVEADNMCRIRKAKVSDLVREFDLGKAGGVDMARNGKFLMLVNSEGYTLWNVDTEKIAKQAKPQARWPSRFCVSPDAKRASFWYEPSDGGPGEALYWDLETEKAIYTAVTDMTTDQADQDKVALDPFLFSPDGKTVLAHKGRGGLWGLVLCDADTLNELVLLKPSMWKNKTRKAAFSSDGSKLLSVDAKNCFTLHDLGTNKQIWSTAPKSPGWDIRLLSYSPTGELAFYTNRSELGPGLQGVGEPLILMDTRNGALGGVLDKNVFGPRWDK